MESTGHSLFDRAATELRRGSSRGPLGATRPDRGSRSIIQRWKNRETDVFPRSGIDLCSASVDDGAMAIDFGVELRSLRLRREMSLTQLAAVTHYSKGYLSRVERGLQKPGPQLARACDRILDSEGLLLQGAVSEEISLPSSRGDADGSEMGRRNVLRTIALTLLAGEPMPGRGWTFAAPTTTEDQLLAVLDHSRRTARFGSPHLVLPQLMAGFHVLASPPATAFGPGDRELLTCRYAEYVGWMAQELGCFEAATDWTLRAAQHANRAGRQDLESYLFVRLSGIALDDGRHAECVALAEEALTRSVGENRNWIRRSALLRLGQGRAAQGDRRAVDDCLSAAGDLPVQLPQWTPTFGSTSLGPERTLELTKAWCLGATGRLELACEHFEAETAQLARSHGRIALRFLVNAALMHAEVGEPEPACALVLPRVAELAAVDSAPIRRDLRRLLSRLSRWRHRSAVQELRARVNGVLS